MNIREYLRTRRQRRARRLYEQEKARRDAFNDPNTVDRAYDRARLMVSGMDGMGRGGGVG